MKYTEKAQRRLCHAGSEDNSSRNGGARHVQTLGGQIGGFTQTQPLAAAAQPGHHWLPSLLLLSPLPHSPTDQICTSPFLLFQRTELRINPEGQLGSSFQVGQNRSAVDCTPSPSQRGRSLTGKSQQPQPRGPTWANPPGVGSSGEGRRARLRLLV